MARYWRRMFTAFWMLAAERVPVRKVSRPRASGFCTSSRMRTDPSAFSSASSIRTPLEPTSMTESTAGAPAANAAAAVGVEPEVGDPASSGMGLQHRLELELVLEEVSPLLAHRPLVHADVAPGPLLQRQLGPAG